MEQGRTFLLLGSIACFLAVALGAFAAHGLKPLLSSGSLTTFQTGVEYQFFHGLALLAVGLMQSFSDDRLLQMAGWSFATGVLLFSCSLYLLAVTSATAFAIVTPFGGLAFLIGWGALIWHFTVRS